MAIFKFFANSGDELCTAYPFCVLVLGKSCEVTCHDSVLYGIKAGLLQLVGKGGKGGVAVQLSALAQGA